VLDQADRSFRQRLSAIRELFGHVPTFYPNCSLEQATFEVDNEDLEDSLLFAKFADLLVLKGEKHPLAYAIDGAGEQAYFNHGNLRPTQPKASRPCFDYRPDFPHELRWRAWLMSPSGPTMVITDERMPVVQLIVCYGVHNGTHLDHLSHFSRSEPSRIEFGEGILLSESLAMSAEMLAGAEALTKGNADLCDVVRDNLIERLGRIPLPHITDYSAGYVSAQAKASREFRSLPTFASAYSVGAVRLIRKRYADPLIPHEIASEFLKRWDAVCNENREIQSMYLAMLDPR
ncbi:MAG: hypothetical protein AAGF78_14585, partial [Pseudomonadota bacterium]